MEGGPKFSKVGLSMGVTFGDDTTHNGNNIHLLPIMHTKLSQKFGLHDLMNRTPFLKVKG